MVPRAGRGGSFPIGQLNRRAPFVFREDGWFNMTKAAQHFGKSLDDFWRNKEVRDYRDALEALNVNPADSREYVEANRGRYGGTWAHPKLAVFFAHC